uniref:Uncharacterized protein n=1 Tax=Mesocestoides corti TaxID=53468 RepID=A0A5K3EI76_MESCO
MGAVPGQSHEVEAGVARLERLSNWDGLLPPLICGPKVIDAPFSRLANCSSILFSLASFAAQVQVKDMALCRAFAVSTKGRVTYRDAQVILVMSHLDLKDQRERRQ